MGSVSPDAPDGGGPLDVEREVTATVAPLTARLIAGVTSPICPAAATLTAGIGHATVETARAEPAR
jgi:hypothetical protein